MTIKYLKLTELNWFIFHFKNLYVKEGMIDENKQFNISSMKNR